MKRILIINNNMHLGGVQKSLVNLLHEIHERDIEITLLLFYPGGELMRDLPKDVKVITPCRALRVWGMTKYDVNPNAKEGRDLSTASARCTRAFWAGMTRLAGRKKAFRMASIFQKRLAGYDAVISFLHSGPDRMFYGGCNEFALSCTDAKKKITFLHCDFEQIQGNTETNRALYRQFEVIAACSGGCRDAFLRCMPELSDKVTVVPNCQDYEEIRQLADAKEVSLAEDCINLLTVARFGKEKGILRGIRAIGALGTDRERIQYHIIGSGAEYEAAKELIAKLHLEKTVHLLGEMRNPYGYMKAADLLFIPSVSEAAPMVIGEAASLGTPVLTTETSSAREMVEEAGYGWVCENSEEGMTGALRGLMHQTSQIEERRNYLQNLSYGNESALAAFYRLLR